MSTTATGIDASGVAAFEANLVEFVRSFGLLQPDRTPCGQPLHVSQAHALSAIAATPGISQHELTTTLGLARATVSEHVTELVARGWIERRRCDEDKRMQRLTLTPAGERVAGQIARSRHALLTEILGELDDDERASAIAVIGKLAESARVARTPHRRAASQPD